MLSGKLNRGQSRVLWNCAKGILAAFPCAKSHQCDITDSYNGNSSKILDRGFGGRSEVGTRRRDSETGLWAHRLVNKGVQVAEQGGLAEVEGEPRSQVT